MMCITHIEYFGVSYSMRHPKGKSRDLKQCHNCRKYEKEQKICPLVVQN